uniref:Uncharacterized protein LOC105129510 isoform X5 n=1 Tax=Rhizophora mucronata TaxID=61149 RepID=A0A2P2KP92_RHIMU
MDDCRRRSQTRRTSLKTSGLSGDEFAQQDSRVKDSMSTEWTDEKHSLYLKSMEASFVDQLYNSMDLLAWKSKKQVLDPKMTQHVNCDSCTSSGQFKVLRYGGWQKIHFRRPESQRNVGNESLGLLSSPWIQHFISARKPQVAPSSTIQETAVPQRMVNRCENKTTSCGSSATSRSKNSSRRSRSQTYHHHMFDGNEGAVI